MKDFIAIVDDEPDIRELVTIHLEKSGFRSQKYASAESFLTSLPQNIPSLIVLDLMLPDIDGIEVCKRLKSDARYRHIPIIMLTARGEELDRVLGLELGADDYVTKPFSPRELVARVKAVLRRNQVPQQENIIRIHDDLVIDTRRFMVYVDGAAVELTATEFKLLKMLAAKRGMVFSRREILDNLWEAEKIVVDRTVDVHIKHLRDKLGPAAEYLKNVRGVGYKIE